ncbi:MAG: NAD(P)H-hydrate dehydratase [Patescibacteria group bacterium]
MQVSKILPTRIVDANAEYRGVPAKILMANAGRAAAREILRKFGKPKKAQIFCGGGGNGGDGFVVAAELLNINPRDFSGEVEVILAVPESQIRSAAARYHFKKITSLTPQLTGGLTERLTLAIHKYSPNINFDGDILIDALLGVGAAGKLKSPFDAIVRRLRNARGKLVSLDVPTGNLKPDLVVAFHSSKNSRNEVACPERAKRIEVVVPIGIPKIAETHFGPGDAEFYFPRRAENSRKGKNGRVIVIGGSAEFVGAPLFAATGALASGVDLVDLFVPAVNFAAARKFSPNFLVKKFRGNPEFLTSEAAAEILKFAEKTNAAIVVGCGLGRNSETAEAVRLLARKSRQPLVFDADALLPDLPKFISKKVVLTPHARELERLGGNAKLLAKNLNAVILKKGRVDEIISPDGRVRWNDSGDPILTAGGTGDTLAGVVGGLLARGIEPFEAAGIAAFLIGLAGERLAVKSESITPQMLAKKIPSIIHEILTKKS